MQSIADIIPFNNPKRILKPNQKGLTTSVKIPIEIIKSELTRPIK